MIQQIDISNVLFKKLHVLNTKFENSRINNLVQN
jgi:hypothetical protein